MGAFDDLVPQVNTGGAFDDLVPKSTVGTKLSDAGVDVLGGLSDIGKQTYGLANLLTGGELDKRSRYITQLANRAAGVEAPVSESPTIAQGFNNIDNAISGLHSAYRQNLEAQRSAAIQKANGVGEEMLAGIGETLKNPSLLVGDILRSAPSMIAPALVGRTVAARAASPLAAEHAVNATTALGQVGGGVNVDTINRIYGTDQATLEQNPVFAELRQQGLSPEEARAEMARRGGLEASFVAAPISYLASKLTGAGRQLTNVVTGQYKGAGLRELGKAAGREAGQEYIESGGEQLGQNLGARDYGDVSTDPMKGVAGAAAQGALAGGVMGGGEHIVGHQTHRDLGINPNAGPLSQAAAVAVDSGAAPSVRQEAAPQAGEVAATTNQTPATVAPTAETGSQASPESVTAAAEQRAPEASMDWFGRQSDEDLRSLVGSLNGPMREEAVRMMSLARNPNLASFIRQRAATGLREMAAAVESVARGSEAPAALPAPESAQAHAALPAPDQQAALPAPPAREALPAPETRAALPGPDMARPGGEMMADAAGNVRPEIYGDAIPQKRADANPVPGGAMLVDSAGNARPETVGDNLAAARAEREILGAPVPRGASAETQSAAPAKAAPVQQAAALPSPDMVRPGGELVADTAGGVRPETYGDALPSRRAEQQAQRQTLGEQTPRGAEAAPTPAKPMFPFATQEAAARVAQQLSERTGQQYDVKPHPDVKGSFAIVPRAPLTEQVQTAAHEAATSPLNERPEPTAAQAAAGNYRKGHINLHGLDISIENPEGSIRRGADRNGKQWEQQMQDHYGYIKGTVGRDKDHVDVFVGPHPESQAVYVVDQVDPSTGKFDEHKVVVGARSLDEARQIYQRNYAADWQGLGQIHETDIRGLKDWIKNGDTRTPFAEHAAKGAANAEAVRSDEGRVHPGGDERAGSENQGGENLQREATAGGRPGNKQAGRAKEARVDEGRRGPPKQKPTQKKESLGKSEGPAAVSPMDARIHGMAADGRSAADILKEIAVSGSTPFNRLVARLLIAAKINPTIEIGTSAGIKFQTGEGTYAAAYNPEADSISLFTPRRAEQNILHEMIHSATYTALKFQQGTGQVMMRRLFDHVSKLGGPDLKQQYGMSNVFEFVAEAFSNPQFQEYLKSVPAMPGTTKLANAWQAFVRAVRSILGIPQSAENALSQALDIGSRLIEENSAVENGRDLNSESLGMKSEKVTLTHMSPDPDLTVVKDKGMFRGIFAGGEVGGGHGKYEYAVQLDHGEIARTRDLQNGDWNIVKKILQREYPKATEAQLGDIVYRAVIDDDINYHDDIDELSAITGLSPEEASWEAQKVRGMVAKALGYKAVAVSDEYGTSYLVLPGVELHRAKDGEVLGVRDNMPEWLQSESADTREAARKAGLWAPEKTLKERFDELRQNAAKKLTQGIFDQFAPIKDLDYRAYMLSRMTKSSDAGLEATLFYGRPVLDADGALRVDPQKDGFIGVLRRLGGEQDRFFAWIAGNRAAQLKAEGKENLFTDTDISALKNLNQGQMPDGRSRAMIYADVHRELNLYSKAVLDIAEKTGLINGVERATWERDFYVPFYRVLEEGDSSGPRNLGGLTNQYAFKKLKGGTESLNDLLANTLQNWSHLLSASLKNQAAASTLKAAQQVGVAAPISEAQKGSVFVLKDGRKQHYLVSDPFLLDAISAMDFSGFKGPAMKLMGAFKRALTIGVTISPTFRIRNLIRDQLSAIGANPMSYNVMQNLVDGVKYSAKDNPEYAQMLAGGALMRMGSSLEENRAAATKRLIDAGIDQATVLDGPEKVKDAIRRAWDWWKEVGERSEAVTRAAIYKQMTEQGKSHLEASFTARDAMDFSLQGAWPAVRMLTQVVPFMNARLQGLYKLGRAAKADKRRFGTVLGATTLATIALALAYRDDEDWKRRPEYDRDNFWWFKVGDTAYRIPKPFEIGAMASIAERGLDAALDGFDVPARQRFADRLISIIGDNLSMNPVPQVFKPALDLYANYDSFRGQAIETPGMENLSKPERIGSNTSAVARALGKADMLSPVQIDHLIDGYFGWLGSHAVMLADIGMRPAMGLPERPERKIDDYFTIGDWAKSLPSNQSRYVDLFYKQSKQIQQAAADLAHAKQIGDVEKVRSLIAERGSEIGLAPAYRQSQETISKINQQIRFVENSGMSPAEKRDRLDRLYAVRNRIAENVVERMRQR